MWRTIYPLTSFIDSADNASSERKPREADPFYINKSSLANLVSLISVQFRCATKWRCSGDHEFELNSTKWVFFRLGALIRLRAFHLRYDHHCDFQFSDTTFLFFFRLSWNFPGNRWSRGNRDNNQYTAKLRYDIGVVVEALYSFDVIKATDMQPQKTEAVWNVPVMWYQTYKTTDTRKGFVLK